MAENSFEQRAAQWDHTAQEAKTALRARPRSNRTEHLEILSALRSRLAAQRDLTAELVERSNIESRVVLAQLERLGRPPGDAEIESEAVAQHRADLNDRLSVVQAPIFVAQDANAQAIVLIADIDDQITASATDRRLARAHLLVSPLLWIEFYGEVTTAFRIAPLNAQMQIEHAGGWQVLIRNLAILFAALLAGWFVMSRLHVALSANIRKRIENVQPLAWRLVLAFVDDALSLFLPIVGLLLVTIACGIVLQPLIEPIETIIVLFIAGVSVIFAQLLGHWIFRSSFEVTRLINLPEKKAARANRLVRNIGLVIGTELVLEFVEEYGHIPPATNNILSVLIVTTGSWYLWKLSNLLIGERRAAKPEALAAAVPEDRPAGTLDFLTPLNWLMKVPVIAALIVAFLGFSMFARELFIMVMLSLAVASAARYLHKTVSMVAEALAEQASPRFHRTVRLMPMLAGFLLTVLLIPVLALIWGYRVEEVGDFLILLRNGVSFGDIRIGAGDVITFLFVFFIVYAITRWIQRIIEVAVLPELGIESGARSAILTGFRYFGILLAAVIAFATTGLDLSGIAFIAGALSVGIGFGLQAVIENFVSGIILLIERPVREGDWIEVGGVSGIVSKIAVRSTHIQTFDSNEVIIPNSELVTGKVRNFTHDGAMGRIKVSVGVAYGTDLDLVRTILLDIADKHEAVLEEPSPSLNLTELGDSALNFELLCFLADINLGNRVRSQLFHAIIARFAIENIEIPFPQNDLRVRAENT